MKLQVDTSSKTSTTTTLVEESESIESTNLGTTGSIYRRNDEQKLAFNRARLVEIDYASDTSRIVLDNDKETCMQVQQDQMVCYMSDAIRHLNHCLHIKDKNEDTKDLLREKYLAERRKLGSDETFTLLSFNEAPSHLQFNPFIKTGYRGYLSTKMCVESIFWWTNETINIWSHIFGWMLFLGLTLYDLLLLNIHASLTDKFIVGMLLVCFQVCMILSSMYHTFSCRSEKDYWCFLTYDLLGISLSLLAIYLSGIYYAFWCHKDWQHFYLSTVLLIFVFAMVLQWPRLNVSSNLKLLVFVAWAAYGVVPTFHWTIIMGGMDNPVVQLLLPRVLGMYGISSLAFLIYITKVPERFFTGKVDYIGSSHQWWHFFVVLALYYWHNTGIKYVEYRMNHGCSTSLLS